MNTEAESVRIALDCAAPARPGSSGMWPLATGAGEHITSIAPSRGWQSVNLAELWKFRGLVYFLIWRDIKVKYKQTLLGAAWAVLQPAAMMVVFTLFFSKVARVPSGDLPYPLFSYAGLLPWTFFATALTSAGNSVVASERLVTKIYFPRLAIPLAAVGAATVDFLIAFGLLVVLMLWYGVMPGPMMLTLPLVVLPIFVCAMGVGALLSALTVRYRDFRYVVPFMVQLWLFATPSVYMQIPADAGGWIRTLAAINPMTALVGAFRAAVLGGQFHLPQFVVACGISGGLLLVGCLYFRRIEDVFADTI